MASHRFETVLEADDQPRTVDPPPDLVGALAVQMLRDGRRHP
jgi:hypothetical protein